MIDTDVLGQLAAGLDPLVSRLLVPAWCITLLVLLPAIWRLLRGQGRHTDAIWGLSFLGISNRLTYLLHISPLLSHLTALLVAFGVAGFAAWYQLDER